LQAIHALGMKICGMSVAAFTLTSQFDFQNGARF
jgi:hypothetical protein